MYKPRKETCSTPHCECPPRPGQRSCYNCHRNYMADYRKRTVTVSVKDARAMMRVGIKAIGKHAARTRRKAPVAR